MSYISIAIPNIRALISEQIGRTDLFKDLLARNESRREEVIVDLSEVELPLMLGHFNAPPTKIILDAIGEEGRYNIVNAYIQEFPGNCGIMIAFKILVHKHFAKQNYTDFIELLKLIARRRHYSLLMVTDIDSSRVGGFFKKELYASIGFQKVLEFQSRRTDNINFIDIIPV